ncbi:MAG: hypothetical protein AAFQ19_07870 [Pseudomonadota bacterium]
MADKSASTPPPKPGAQTDRDARLKAALKANLARRKAQARMRNTAEKGAGTQKEQDNG